MNDAELARVERLLSSPALHVGSSRFIDGDETRAYGDEIRVFVAHLEGLDVTADEIVLLDERSDVSTSDGVEAATVRLAEELASRFAAARIWRVAPTAAESTMYTSGGCEVRTCRAADLFYRLIEMPRKFVQSVPPGFGVETEAFKSAFRRRSANSPPVVPAGMRRVSYRLFDDELADWADSGDVEKPILLLGDRGSGKTWELLKFCQDRYDLLTDVGADGSRVSPWLHPPALFVTLRGAIAYFSDTNRSALGLYGLLKEQCRWFSVKWNANMFQALLENGRIIVCFDSLDEVEVQPATDGLRDHFRRIVGMLPIGSRFIISCRTTHFASYDQMYQLETWLGKDVRGTFRVVELSPFNKEDLKAYTSAVSGNSHLRDRFEKSLAAAEHDALRAAVQRCAEQPALLVRMVDEAIANQGITDFELVGRAIEGSLIEFNLDAERTRPLLLDRNGRLRHFDAQARGAFLGELAWFMAERSISRIDLERIPLRVTRMFGVDSDALEDDIRSQTVFELEPDSSLLQRSTANSSERNGGAVRFGLVLHDSKASVSASYFLASHIASRLRDAANIPGVVYEDTLRYLGRVSLDGLTAAFLGEMLGRGYESDAARQLRPRVTQHLVELAKQGGCRVFMQSLRYVMQNLETLGYVTPAERARFDPWMGEAADRVCLRSEALPDYSFALVPAPMSAKINGLVRAAGVGICNRPFLLGVHEVTNEQFERFIQTSEGSEWTVEKLTRARSDGSPSAKAHYTNEYHLYFWEQPADGESFHPPYSHVRHPVVYVSWFVAQAFCTWLSGADGRDPTYSFETDERAPGIGRANLAATADRPGYRLPMAHEWWWSAQGMSDAPSYAWELVPYCVDEGVIGRLSTGGHAETEEAQRARTWLTEYRKAAASVLADSGRRSAQVAYDDEVGPFGVIGLIGNVKEWVNDRTASHTDDDDRANALVCGGTAHLGKPSFRIGYFAKLFPENTNPDVGFRVARSLSDAEIRTLLNREAELAAMAPVT